MAYEIEVGADRYHLATISDWGAFLQWLESLDDATYPDLIHLGEFGWSDGPVAEQIEHALAITPPADEVAAATARYLADLLRGRDDDEVVRVTDGDEDEDDEPEPEPPAA